MSRYRLYPAPDQVPMLAEHCQQERALWNVCVEQQSYYVRGGTRPPGRAERYRQLTEARAESDWLRKGSVTVQQQALRDFDQALANFFRGTHRKPTFRKRGRSESFRVVGKDARVEKLNRKWSRCWVPKLGWVRFRRSRDLPAGVRSYRIIMDRAGRWHVAFAARPDPVDGPGTGDRGDRRGGSGGGLDGGALDGGDAALPGAVGPGAGPAAQGPAPGCPRGEEEPGSGG